MRASDCAAQVIGGAHEDLAVKVLLDVESELTFRGSEVGQVEIQHARHDAGAPRPARLTVRDRQLRSSAPCTSPRPPRMVDLSASHARAPLRILLPLTTSACSTFSQAWISRARPRAASAAPRAATRRHPLFMLAARVRQRWLAPRRGLCSPMWVWRRDLWLN